MPQKYVRKTERETLPHNVLLAAVQRYDVVKSMRKVAEEFNMSHQTLKRKIDAYKQNNEAHLETSYKNKMIFSMDQEEDIVKYILRCSELFYCLTPIDLRKLAYATARANNLKVPPKWEAEEMAGVKWLQGFRSRHAVLSLWKPEKTSIARASAFTRYNIAKFFELLNDVFGKYKFPSHRVYNLDESGFSTVQNTRAVFAERGKKQVGQTTSAENGVLVTLVGIVCASGKTIPPAFVFPRVNYKPRMLVGAPPGSLGLAHTSGWMTASNFILVIKHFVKYSMPTVEDPVLLVLDNHESHLSFSVLDYAKNNNVHLLTIPQHSSNKTQPLDRTIFGPAKCTFDALLYSWGRDHNHQSATIYDMASLMGSAFISAATPRNIIRGFEAAGICPLNPNIFTDVDFALSEVSDRPICPQQSASETNSERAAFVELTDASTSDGVTS
ncbi:uncharacterized protein [Lepeophtheirus salmonis]|uniref:DDE-1 domain-containing protein n=1 Tax=Lepeophtheirus salmonis TaxID=72036 RepID=A0A0K2TMI7_LEPSM|nr:uncharacterized protein LOC121122776 [Lepeophtheirus salmonis]XP_040573752.1 uncharacterized protein LOC121122776 [Lepeophtheirus salmonis]